MKKKLVITMISLLIFSLIINFLLIERVFDYQSIAEKTISGEVYKEEATKKAIEAANKANAELSSLETSRVQQLNELASQSLNQQFPEYTSEITGKLKTTYEQLYNYNGNLDSQQKLLQEQSTDNQNYFQNEMNNLKKLNKCVVKKIQCFYQYKNKHLMAVIVIDTIESNGSNKKNTTHTWVVGIKNKNLGRVYQISE
ncbi:hypothetical protein [Liquorilactobacillus hordei]|uniref:hypothetical protein n=1 Tax=Liquorilactobacillus hordei TaxID=468911 RepID=UPI001CBB5D09|nr:hypothetical protein [Liquorilactobacillus hordei]MBZ2406656.1 hypothetical protein [Liquorilactobacillus hordei]